jgi:phage gpG-like protein
MGRDNLNAIINQLTALAEEAGKSEGEKSFPTSFSLGRFSASVVSKPSKQQIADIFRQVNERAIIYIKDALKKALDDAMQANIWEGGSDIVDTGELMNSLEITIEGDSVTMAYTSEYAAIVHYGGYIRPYGNESAEKVYIPGRPWLQAVIEGYGGIAPVDVTALYYKALGEVIG